MYNEGLKQAYIENELQKQTKNNKTNKQPEIFLSYAPKSFQILSQ